MSRNRLYSWDLMRGNTKSYQKNSEVSGEDEEQTEANGFDQI